MLAAVDASAYPLDASEQTGIYRLEAYFLAKVPLIEMGRLKPGALKPAESVQPSLVGRPQLTLGESDPAFLADIRGVLGEDAGGYGIAVLDISDPDNPRYAEHNGSRLQNPGSVGKIVVALGWFQALADVYPDDLAARWRLLKDTVITADEFILRDTHTVPIWKPGDPEIISRPIEIGDRANLYTYLDWMCSASSNAAAALLQEHLILLKHFGREYPVSDAAAKEFFEKTPKAELGAIFLSAIRDPLKRNGIDSAMLRQGSFFSRTGKAKVPGIDSVASARELTRYMLLMEQGKLVDLWSSREIKRLLYLTDTRIRYASSPALNDSAVYYKSGSLYSCKKEAGFVCEKYAGNRYNYLASIAIVETEEGGRKLHYMVSVLSNVLRKNSAEAHKALAGRIHRLIRDARPAAAPSTQTSRDAVSSATGSPAVDASP
jgi:hypothetical protein